MRWIQHPIFSSQVRVSAALGVGVAGNGGSGIPERENSAMTGDDFTDGYGEGSGGGRNLSGGVDFFGSLGTERKRKDPNENKPDPNKVGTI
jgi:hypothetical protein